MKFIRFVIIGLLFSVSSYSQFLAVLSAEGEGVSPLLDSLFAYYTLDEASGNAIDVHGSNNLIASGSVTYQQTGKINDCHYYETNGELSDGITEEFNFPASFSFAFWVKTTDTEEGFHALLANFSAPHYGWDYQMGGSGISYLNYYYNGGSVQLNETTLLLNDGDWHYVASTYSSADNSIKLYIDGALKDSDDLGASLYWDAANEFCVAHRIGGLYTDVYMDEIAIWRGKELDITEIGLLYNSGSGLAYPLDY